MDGQVGFAVIGCGMISRFHIAGISRAEKAVLVGVFDISREHGEKTAACHQVKYYASLEEIWEDEAVDAVCICTPSGLHARAACQAVAHGRHVLVEKPMALTLEDCDRILKLAEEHHVKVSVVSQLRFSPAVRQARKLLQEKALGKLLNADLHMKYYRSQEYYDSGGWRGTWAMDGGGALMNQGIHGVDLLLYLAGPVESVFARAATLTRRIEVEDTLSGVVVFESGALGVIQADTGVYPGFPRRIELCGDKGSLILEEDKIIYASFQEKNGCAGSQAGSGEDTKAGASEAGEEESGEKGHQNPGAISAQGHFLQISNLVNAILYEEPLLADGYDGRRAVELILKTYKSAREERVINIPLEERKEGR